MSIAVATGRELTAIAITCGANAAVHRLMPHATHVPVNLGVAGAVIGLARSSGASWDDLGLQPGRLGAGARLGAIAGGVAAGGIGLALCTPATRDLLVDQRVAGVGRGRAAYELAVRIPLGTALAEEMLFRSAFPALFGRRRRRIAAVALSNALFGAWHILPTLHSLQTNQVAHRVSTTPARRALALLTPVAATALAGFGFDVLRRRSGSVVAPAIAHAMLNASAYAAGRLGAR